MPSFATPTKGPNALAELDACVSQPADRVEQTKNDPMDIERIRVVKSSTPISKVLAELCNYRSDDDSDSDSDDDAESESAAPSRYPSEYPSTPPPFPLSSQRESYPCPALRRFINGPSPEEKRRSDLAYFLSEPMRTSPPRPLVRQAVVCDEATFFEMINTPECKKRARCEDDSDEEDRMDGGTVEPGHRSKRMRPTELESPTRTRPVKTRSMAYTNGRRVTKDEF